MDYISLPKPSYYSYEEEELIIEMKPTLNYTPHFFTRLELTRFICDHSNCLGRFENMKQMNHHCAMKHHGIKKFSLLSNRKVDQIAIGFKQNFNSSQLEMSLMENVSVLTKHGRVIAKVCKEMDECLWKTCLPLKIVSSYSLTKPKLEKALENLGVDFIVETQSNVIETQSNEIAAQSNEIETQSYEIATQSNEITTNAPPSIDTIASFFKNECPNNNTVMPSYRKTDNRSLFSNGRLRLVLLKPKNFSLPHNLLIPNSIVQPVKLPQYSPFHKIGDKPSMPAKRDKKGRPLKGDPDYEKYRMKNNQQIKKHRERKKLWTSQLQNQIHALLRQIDELKRENGQQKEEIGNLKLIDMQNKQRINSQQNDINLYKYELVRRQGVLDCQKYFLSDQRTKIKSEHDEIVL